MKTLLSVFIFNPFPDADWACRWCFGMPIRGREYCRKAACMSNVGSLLALDYYSDMGVWQ